MAEFFGGAEGDEGSLYSCDFTNTELLRPTQHDRLEEFFSTVLRAKRGRKARRTFLIQENQNAIVFNSGFRP